MEHEDSVEAIDLESGHGVHQGNELLHRSNGRRSQGGAADRGNLRKG
ncbi:hypothetical protein ACFYL6_03220 [Micromonospora sp. NPDC007208]